MKLSLQTQILPSREQAKALRATVERFNEAASWLSGIAFERKVGNKFILQRIAYAELRERFGLTADMAVRCIGRVCDAFKSDSTKRSSFDKHAAVPFSSEVGSSKGRGIGFRGSASGVRVSISTLSGRVEVPLVMGAYQRDRLGRPCGHCELLFRDDGKWFLLVAVDMPDRPLAPPSDFIGVDLGVENIAADSDGEIHSSKAIDSKRIGYARRRRNLGRACKGASRNTRRRCRKAIKETRGKEARYRRHINHKISKDLVVKAKVTDRGIALEDLEGIRDRITVRRHQRDRFNAWSYSQLRGFVLYKAKLAGVAVEFIDPAYTSRTCGMCGHIAKSNRKSQPEFQCKACGHQQHADVNAARNIRARAVCQAAHGDGKGRARDASLMPSTVASLSPSASGA